MVKVKLLAIGSITWLETLNILFFGVDGALLGLCVGAISGIAGYEIGLRRNKRKRKRKKSKTVIFTPLPNDI